MSLLKLFVWAQIAVKRFLDDKSGASGIEYAIIAAMVAVAIISFSSTIRTGVEAIFQSNSDSVTTKSA